MDCAACSMVSEYAQYNLSTMIAKSIYDEDVWFPTNEGCPYPPNPNTDEHGFSDCAVDVYSAQLFYCMY